MTRTHAIKSLLLAALALAWPSLSVAQTWVDSTTLSAALDATDTEVSLASASGVAVGDTLYVDGEAMSALAVDGTTVTVRRGVGGGVTPARAHASGVRIWVGAPEEFDGFSPAGTCSRSTERYLPHIDTTTNRVFDCEGGYWLERYDDPVFVRQNTIRDSFDQGYFIHQDDMSVESVADDEDNVVHGSPLGVWEYREELAKTTSSFVIADGTLDISADDTTNDEGVEIAIGVAEGTDLGYFVAGTSGACISASVTITDISGTDQVLVGFRQNEAFTDAANFAGYTVWNTVGDSATDGSILSEQEVSEATDNDDSGVNWADGETRALKVCVDVDGVPTAFYTDAYTHSQTVTDWPAWNAIDMSATGSTWTADLQGVPFFTYMAAGTDGADVVVNWVQLTRLPPQ